MPDNRKGHIMSIKQVTKKDGSTVYRETIYLGIDALTDKRVQKRISASSMSELKRKIAREKVRFDNEGQTHSRASVKFSNFAELTESWWENYKLTVRENSYTTMLCDLNTYIYPALGKYKVSKVTAPLLQQIVNQWAKNANTTPLVNGKRPKGSAKDYKLLLNIVKRILGYALTLGEIKDNPALRVTVPRLNKKNSQKLKYFDNTHLKRWLDYLDNLPDTDSNNYDIVLYKTLLYTGMRISEALALEWSDIDFKKQIIHVSRTVTRTGKMQDAPKTGHGVREIMIDTSTCHMLQLFQFRQRTIFGMQGIHDIHPVFPSTIGTRKAYSNIITALNIHFKNAKVPSVGFHGFRHTHASLLLNAGAGYKEIQQRLGHASIKMTMDIYSHLAPDKSKEAAALFTKAINEIQKTG